MRKIKIDRNQYFKNTLNLLEYQTVIKLLSLFLT